MKTAIIIWLAACVTCAAQFVSVWPAWQYQRAGKQQAAQIWTATVERCTILGQNGYGNWFVSPPAAQTWYRSQRANLMTVKTTSKHLANDTYAGFHYFADQAQSSGGNYNSFFLGNGGTNNWPQFDVVSYCQRMKMPTNYYDYTPWRCLNGLGPFTNDLTVGHGYGWTNVYTLAGGTNFPGTRSAWYTTDYGWNPACVSGLVWSLAFLTACTNTADPPSYLSLTYLPAWADAVTECDATYTNAYWYTGLPLFPFAMSAGYVNGDYYVQKARQRMVFAKSGMSTNFQHVAQFYFKAQRYAWLNAETRPPLFRVTNETLLAWSDNGDSVTTNFELYAESSESAGASWDVVVGTVDVSALPETCAEPTTPSAFGEYATGRGWMPAYNPGDGHYYPAGWWQFDPPAGGGAWPFHKSGVILLKWDGPNGLKYK